jgi:hypothetical protein
MINSLNADLSDLTADFGSTDEKMNDMMSMLSKGSSDDDKKSADSTKSQEPSKSDDSFSAIDDFDFDRLMGADPFATDPKYGDEKKGDKKDDKKR